MKSYSLILFFVFILYAFSSISAQTDNSCSCCSEAHQAFDFWIGDWNVFNTNGKQVGENEVLQLQNGCVIQENWTASNKTNTGTSYNYFNASDSTWNQVWVSSTGNVLELKGNLNKEGAMVLKSALKENKKGKYCNQIKWTENSDGSVTQQWDILNEKGDVIKQVFTGVYKLKD